MKRFIIVVLTIFTFISGFSQTERIVDDFILNFTSGKYSECAEMLTGELKDKYNEEYLSEKDSLFIKLYGKSQVPVHAIKTFYDDKDIELRFLWYGDTRVKFKFVVEQGKIEELNIAKESVRKGWKHPEYVERAKFRIKPVLIQSANYALPGEITSPVNKTRDKWLIFIHGSGPSDRDESVFAIKTFKDLAFGLASKGISGLRYDKNTYLFGKEMSKNKRMTIWDETGKDVVSAVNYLKKYEDVKSEDIILLGHSQGAMMIPRICDSVQVGAAIMIAGNARPLQELIYEQMKFLMAKDGLDEGEKRRLKIQEEQIENLEKLKNTHPDSVDFVIPYGLSAHYWKDLLEYDQVETLKEIDIPVFLIQGKGDYQVSMKDFRKFRRALRRSDSDWKAVAYDKLNHLLFENKDEPSREEYEREENVEKYIIEDILSWIKNLDQ